MTPARAALLACVIGAACAEPEAPPWRSPTAAEALRFERWMKGGKPIKDRPFVTCPTIPDIAEGTTGFARVLFDEFVTECGQWGCSWLLLYIADNNIFLPLVQKELRAVPGCARCVVTDILHFEAIDIVVGVRYGHPPQDEALVGILDHRDRPGGDRYTLRRATFQFWRPSDRDPRYGTLDFVCPDIALVAPECRELREAPSMHELAILNGRRWGFE